MCDLFAQNNSTRTISVKSYYVIYLFILLILLVLYRKTRRSEAIVYK